MSHEISQSKLKTWRTCRKQYFYKYTMKLQKKRKPYALLRGTIVHEMMEAHYKGLDPWKSYKKLIKENDRIIRLNPEEYGDMPEDLKKIMTGYFDYYEDDKLKVIKVEHEFRTKLVDDIYLVGKMDLVAKAQKLNWLVEHKAHNKIPEGSMVPYSNLQSGIYVWDWNKNNPKQKVDGIMWNYLWGKPPGSPEVLKNGGMSRRVTQNITWPIYREALIKNKLDPKDYADMKESLKGNEANFYQRKFVPINQKMVDNIIDDTKVTAQEIVKLAGKDQTRNLGHHCDFCEFKDLCAAQLKGMDDNFIIKSDFITRTKK